MTAAETIRQHAPNHAPRLALVLGSGLGALADRVEDAVTIPYGELDGFPAAGVSGHAGQLVLGLLSGVPVAVCQGRAHAYETGNAAVMRPVIETLKGIGVEALFLTNAAGSLRADMPPGSLMAIEDHINLSGTNPLIGDEDDARFTPMTGAYDEALTAILADGLTRGVYAWMMGPSFETPAEIRMLQRLGADAVGMSTVPEVILGRRLGLRVCALSTITNLGAGMADEHLSHAQTKREGAKAAERFIEHVERALPRLGAAL